MVYNLNFKKEKNIRDLWTIDHKIKKHKLIRSCCLDYFTYDDIKILVDYFKIKTIIDLRTPREREQKPNPVIDGIKYYEIPIFEEEVAGITHESHRGKITKFVDMETLYSSMIDDECIDNVKKVIHTIMNSEYPVLYHCTQGKDRTGLISMLILTILGYSKEAIMYDYLYSNKVLSKKARKYYLILKWKERDMKKANNVKAIFEAREEYLDAVYYTIDKKYGGMDNFIKNTLGITDEMIYKFKSEILER